MRMYGVAEEHVDHVITQREAKAAKSQGKA